MKKSLAALLFAATLPISPVALALDTLPQDSTEEEEQSDPYMAWVFPLFMWLYFGFDGSEN